ncbi:MAG: ParA family protein [Anaerolineae bacterium]|nr:ParA family protein [Anaerolineae bacterium]
MAHVIAITNQKGGVGKTTTAINLGAALAEMGHYTLLGDLDPQGGLSLGLGLAAHDLDLTIYNILTDTRIPVAGITHHVRAHLDLLPSNIDLAVAEFQLIAQMGREYILREALQSVRAQYEYIVLDCPPSLNLLTVNALTAADAIIVPLQVEYFAMRGLEQLMDVYSRVRRRLNPDLEIIGIVPTMVDVRRTNDQQILQEVTKAYPGMLLDVYVKESIKFADAPRHQRSILELDPRHDGARAYRKLAHLVLQYYGEYVEPEPELPEEPAEAAVAAVTTEPAAVETFDFAAPEAEKIDPPIQIAGTLEITPAAAQSLELAAPTPAPNGSHIEIVTVESLSPMVRQDADLSLQPESGQAAPVKPVEPRIDIPPSEIPFPPPPRPAGDSPNGL